MLVVLLSQKAFQKFHLELGSQLGSNPGGYLMPVYK